MGSVCSQRFEATSVSNRCYGKDWKVAGGCDEIVLVDLYLLSSDVGPLWSQRSEGTSVSIGCFGREWNRRESEEKALLEELLSV